MNYPSLAIGLLLVVFSVQAQYIPTGGGSGGTDGGSNLVGTLGSSLGTPLFIVNTYVLNIVDKASQNRKAAHPNINEDFKNLAEVISFLELEKSTQSKIAPEAEIDSSCSTIPIQKFKSKILSDEIVQYMQLLLTAEPTFILVLGAESKLNEKEARAIIKSIKKIVDERMIQ